MTIELPQSASMLSHSVGMSSKTRLQVLARWNPRVCAAQKNHDRTLSIFEPIGRDAWSDEGVHASRVSAVLRAMGGKDIEVHINSPGGDLFEGLAIYNLLRAYSDNGGKVTVKVLGLAASAASVIAMAGDEIYLAHSAFYMIHNAHGLKYGDQHALRNFADALKAFDHGMAHIYATRSGQSLEALQQMMNDETWLCSSDAVAHGLADALIDAPQGAAPASRATQAQQAMQQAYAAAPALETTALEAALRRLGQLQTRAVC